ncbi:MAG TPA: GNAT family N-acetyltransferase [Puia sp.]|nr:GNAT family N-acetyltransferase [Puia sp.]
MNQTDLLRDATTAQLERAAALNHTELFGLDAIALGGEVRQKDGLTWTQVGTSAESIIAFPELSPDTAGAQLDGLIAEYLLHPPKGAGCWSLDPPQPADLGLRLLARGFQPGWRPCWMALDLEKMSPAYPSPKGLRVLPDNLTPLLDVKGLPYARAIIPPRPSPPEQPHGAGVQRFVAWMNKKVVGHSGVLLTTGAYGVAGIYHVGVVPGARNKGIGKAVVKAACLYARERGYRYAVLNATGRRMYEQIGFTWLGDGWTWWLKGGRLLTHPPGRTQVALAEAVGRGDLQALDHPDLPFSEEDLHRPLTNGMTLVQLAVHCRQPASGEWLLSRGCAFQALDAWDLGWKDRAARLLRESPGQVNQLYGEWELTLLHIAAERNDTELAGLVLSARPNLKIKDKAYQSTAREWARHFGHQEILRLIPK